MLTDIYLQNMRKWSFEKNDYICHTYDGFSVTTTTTITTTTNNNNNNDKILKFNSKLFQIILVKFC